MPPAAKKAKTGEVDATKKAAAAAKAAEAKKAAEEAAKAAAEAARKAEEEAKRLAEEAAAEEDEEDEAEDAEAEGEQAEADEAEAEAEQLEAQAEAQAEEEEAAPPAHEAEASKEDVEMEPAAEEEAAPVEEAAPAEEAAPEPVPEVPELPPAPEPVKELEEDAEEATGPKIKEKVVFATQDTTLNVLPATAGNVLLSLTDGGFQHLLAGARGNVGIKSGRYAFEAKIIQFVNPAESHGNRVPGPKQLLRVGFSTAGSSLLLGESETDISFESEGQLLHHRKRTPIGLGARFGRDNIVTVVLNLEESSPNFNTVSLFKDGVRVSQPQALPDSLKGKTLYPTVTFKNVSVHVNFGPAPLAHLPFKCRMVAEASAADAEVRTYDKPKDGKYEVVFPVGLPDEGTFDWVDGFLAKHPQYTELSDRAILDWAERSGVLRAQGYKIRTSNDKPEMNFGIRELDDLSVKKLLQAVAPVQSRHFVVMEVRGNLLKEERKENLARFAGFKKTAQVVVGEPPKDFKEAALAHALQQKQEASDLQFKIKKAEEARKKLMEKKQKELERIRKKAEKERVKAVLEAKRKLLADKKAAGEEVDEQEWEEVHKEPEEEEEEEAADEDVEMQEEEPPKVELTAEEKKVWFKKFPVPDLTQYQLNTTFSKFTLPEKDEGFDEITFAWADAKKAEAYLKKWIVDRKLTSRVEDISPSEWFNTKHRDWQTVLAQWHAKQNEYKASLVKKAADAAAKEAAKKAKAAAAAAAAAEKAALKAQKEAAAAEAQDGEEKEKEDEPMEAAEEKEAEEPEVQEEEEEEEAPDAELEEKRKAEFEALDVFGVDDVTDLGYGRPLFSEFGYEDWALLSLAFELHLLAHAFKRDANDPERTGIHAEHLGFYYNRYFKKALTLQFYGVNSVAELVELVKDAVHLTKQQLLESLLDDDMESPQVFAKLAEEARRYRNTRLDLGEESAQLKVQPNAYTALGGPRRPPQQHIQPHIQQHAPQYVQQGGKGGYNIPAPPPYAQPLKGAPKGKGGKDAGKGQWGKGGKGFQSFGAVGAPLSALPAPPMGAPAFGGKGGKVGGGKGPWQAKGQKGFGGGYGFAGQQMHS